MVHRAFRVWNAPVTMATGEMISLDLREWARQIIDAYDFGRDEADAEWRGHEKRVYE